MKVKWPGINNQLGDRKHLQPQRLARLETMMGSPVKAPTAAEKQSVANLRMAMEEVDTWPQ